MSGKVIDQFRGHLCLTDHDGGLAHPGTPQYSDANKQWQQKMGPKVDLLSLWYS